MRRLYILSLIVASSAFGQATFVNPIATMGYLYPTAVNVAPGQLITVFLVGNVEGDITATVQNLNAPVVEVRPAQSCAPSPCSSSTAITIQIPYELQPGCAFTNPACDLSISTQLVISISAVAGTPFNLQPVADQIHILTSCDTVLPAGSGVGPLSGLLCAPQVTHADGSLVTSASPAAGGEVLVAYAVGLGLTNPTVPTGRAATVATPTTEIFVLDFNYRPNALATRPPQFAYFPGSLIIPMYTGLVPGYVGLYQVNFVLPPTPAGTVACGTGVQTNLTVSLGGRTSFDGAGICVSPSN
jgi:uncharacterized protein (TIGR03437 family)